MTHILHQEVCEGGGGLFFEKTRMEGYGFITVTNGVGAASTLFTVELPFCINNRGRSSDDIALRYLTLANPQESFM